MVKIKIFVLVIVSFVLFACDDQFAPRPYLLGFTPFPYDTTTSAVADTYAGIARDADLITHHFDEGIPWPEALANTDYSLNIQNDWQWRRNNTPANHHVYVAITPANISRDGLALYRGEQNDMPLPAPWDTYTFDHADVKAAFLNYAIDVIEYFQPDYFAIGIEVNLLLTNTPAHWQPYLSLHRHVYSELKLRYPDLPIFASVFGVALLEGYRAEDDHAAQRLALQSLMQYSDYYAIALYPFMSKYLTNSIPNAMYTDLFSLSDKPIAIAETGYPAESFSIMNGTLQFNSTPAKQRNFIERLLREAEQRNFVFVTNFIWRDYDAIWEKMGRPDIAAIWRDTGFYDAAGVPRDALQYWKDMLSRPYSH